MQAALRTKRGGADGRLIERIEHRPLRRILRRELQHFPAAYPADRDRVVEIERAWIARVDPGRLEARLREHEQLRIDGDIERRQHRLEIAVPIVVGEPDLAGRQPIVEARNRVPGACGRVGDLRMLPQRRRREPLLRP
jgi:hypothetical protein